MGRITRRPQGADLAPLDARLDALEGRPEVPDVSRWPVCIANMNTPDGDGIPPVQTLPRGAFTRLNLNAVKDTHGAFSAANHVWVCPEAGIYRVEMKLRFVDGTPWGLGFGLGADIVERDSPAFRWAATVPARQGEINQRLIELQQGQQLVMFVYWEGNDQWTTGPVKAAEMTIDRIR